jgi:hypothetical protein
MIVNVLFRSFWPISVETARVVPSKEVDFMQPGNANNQDIEKHLKVAHDKIVQAQQTLDNRELNEQRLLEQALDAVNKARQSIG